MNTCKTCKWWDHRYKELKYPVPHENGWCLNGKVEDAIGLTYVRTSKTFGCIYHEVRDDIRG